VYHRSGEFGTMLLQNCREILVRSPFVQEDWQIKLRRQSQQLCEAAALDNPWREIAVLSTHVKPWASTEIRHGN
jgi:hypothetical protein